jgi:outer membrane protein OmpA-like peptidoglycan-associated protein
MQPALLFGGNVTAYVLWAVSSAGVYENLGELVVSEGSGSGRFQTGMKEFAMFVTAEPLSGIWRPSDMVVFASGPTKNKFSKNSTLAFSAFGPVVKHDRESIGTLRWQGQEPIELTQARKAVEAGTEAGLAQYDEKAMREAQTTLAQATNSMGSGGSRKVVTDYARRTTALVTTAARAMYKAQQEKAEADAAAKRKAEVDALNQKAANAQQSAAAADAARQQAEAAEQRQTRCARRPRWRRGKPNAPGGDGGGGGGAGRHKRSSSSRRWPRCRRKRDSAEQAKAEMTATAAARRPEADLEAQMAELTVANERIRSERNALADRLLGALASVAETRNTARGVAVSLPDILFDTNKATLKPEMVVTLAKLAGVLSVFRT